MTNWPGTLIIEVIRYSISKAIAFGGYINRIDVWFELDGWEWHGVNKGDNDILRVKRTKVQYQTSTNKTDELVEKLTQQTVERTERFLNAAN